ncbi:hypothetical protein [Paenibacillus polymyxa]|uniref:hypothetical protein n=1 Tax=Paenibacillus polymyxa TaxID=1406 RepID=UPI0004DF9931|nr:hypothetical protein [Paenibacillus polymyxa]
MNRQTGISTDFTKIFNNGFTEGENLFNAGRFPVNTVATSNPPTVTASNAIDPNPSSPWAIPNPMCELHLDFPVGPIRIHKLYVQAATLILNPGSLALDIEGQKNDGTWSNIGFLSPQIIPPGLPLPIPPIDVMVDDYNSIKFTVKCNVPTGIFDIKYS